MCSGAMRCFCSNQPNSLGKQNGITLGKAQSDLDRNSDVAAYLDLYHCEERHTAAGGSRGVMGALLVVPCTVVLQVLFEQFYRFDEPDIAASEVPTGERKLQQPRLVPTTPAIVRERNSYGTASAPCEE